MHDFLVALIDGPQGGIKRTERLLKGDMQQQKKAEELRQKEEELRRKDEELRRKEEELGSRVEELRRRDEEPRQKEEPRMNWEREGQDMQRVDQLRTAQQIQSIVDADRDKSIPPSSRRPPREREQPSSSSSRIQPLSTGPFARSSSVTLQDPPSG